MQRPVLLLPKLPSRFVVWLKRISVTLALAFFVASGVVLWALDTGRAAEIARRELVDGARAACDVTLAFDDLRLSLFPPAVSLVETTLSSTTGSEFLSVGEARVGLRVLPLLYGRVQLAEVRLVRPSASIALDGAGAPALPRCLATSEASPDDATTPLFGVDQLVVDDAAIALAVSATVSAELHGIHVTLENVRRAGTQLVASWTGGALRQGDHTLEVGEARLRVLVSGPLAAPRALTVESLRAAVGALTVEGSGALDLVGPVYEAKLTVEGPLDAIAAHLPGAPPLGGRARVAASIAGTLAEPRLVAEVALEGVTIGAYGAGDHVEVELVADRRTLDVSSIDARIGPGSVKGRARLVGLDGDAPSLSARLALRDFSLARLLHQLDVRSAWVDFLADGQVTAEGRLAPLELGGKVEVDVRELHVWNAGWDVERADKRRMLAVVPVAVRGKWRADPGGFDIYDATLASARSSGRAHARVVPFGDSRLDIRAEFAALDLEELGPIGGQRIAGRGPVSLAIVGPTSALVGKGVADLEGVEIGERPFGHVKTPITWHDSTLLELEAIEAELGASSYQGRATIDLDRGPDLDLAGTVTRGRLEDLLVAFRERAEDWGRPTGELRARFMLSGPVSALSGPIEGELSSVEVVGEKAERGSVHGAMVDGALRLDDIRLEKRGAELFASLRLTPGATSVDLDVRSEGLRLQSLDAVRAGGLPLDAAVDVDVSLRGPWRANSGTIALTLGELTVGPARLPGGTLEGPVRDGTWSARGGLGAQLAWDGRLEIDRGLPFSGTLRVRGLDAPALVAGALGGPRGLSGVVDGKAELSGSLVEWRDASGSILLERARVERARGDGGEPLAIELADVLRGTLRRRAVELRPTTLVGAGLKATVRGLVGVEETSLALAGSADLAPLPELVPLVERAGGVLVVDASIERRGRQLSLRGTGSVERASFTLARLPGRFTNAQAALRFSDENVIVESAEARYESGEVSATGQLSLRGYQPQALSFAIELVGVRPTWSYPRFDLVSTFTGHLELSGPWERQKLAGRLEAARSTLRPRFDWRSVVASERRVDVQVYDPARENLEFSVDVGFPADDALQLRHETATVDLSGDVTLSGTNQRIGLLGGFAVGRGRASFLGREYQIEGGTIDLRDRYAFQPSYDLVLTARACDASIRVGLVGSLEAVKTSFQSRPEMEETNVVSCLLRGIRIRDLENIRGDSRGNAAASFAGEALWRLSGVDQQVRRVLPVDQIEVTSEYSARERVYEPRILVAKELGEGRLRLEYSSSLLRNDTQRAAVRYRVTPRLTLQYGWMSSEDVTIGDHGVDLRYRWEW